MWTRVLITIVIAWVTSLPRSQKLTNWQSRRQNAANIPLTISTNTHIWLHIEVNLSRHWIIMTPLYGIVWNYGVQQSILSAKVFPISKYRTSPIFSFGFGWYLILANFKSITTTPNDLWLICSCMYSIYNAINFPCAIDVKKNQNSSSASSCPTRKQNIE